MGGIGRAIPHSGIQVALRAPRGWFSCLLLHAAALAERFVLGIYTGLDLGDLGFREVSEAALLLEVLGDGNFLLFAAGYAAVEATAGFLHRSSLLVQ